jgi:FlaA1/EpsC-like NDP-sugar epimerase
MFQSKIEETKNNLNKESSLNGTVIQNFYDGANIFITGGTGEFGLGDLVVIFMCDSLRLHGKGSHR